MERTDDLPTGIKEFEFAVDYDPRNMLLENGGPVALVEPQGLSASAIWRIGVSGGSPSEWKPEHALLVGVITRWEKDKRVLLATDAGSLLRLVRSAGW